jgi:hypothetical protein
MGPRIGQKRQDPLRLRRLKAIQSSRRVNHCFSLICAGAGRGSLPTILKSSVKIALLSAKRNIDAGLRAIFPRQLESSFGRFRVIWGDFGRGFTRKS